MRALLLLIAIIGTTAVSELEYEQENIEALLTETLSKNGAIEQIILNVLENFRETMTPGNHTKKVLDPLHRKKLNINGATYGHQGSHLNITKLVVNELSTFVVEDLKVTMTSLLFQRYTVAFDINIPTVNMKCKKYDLLLSMMGIKIFGKGKARLTLVEPRLSGKLIIRLGISVTGGVGFDIKVENADVKLGLKAFLSEFKGLFGNSGASNFANSFLKHFVPNLIHLYEKSISAFLNKTIIRRANDYFEKKFRV